MSKKKKFIILSGPSCVGKTPLLKTVKKLYPAIHFHSPVLYSSRKPRPIEKDGVDYHFRPEDTVRSLPEDRFIVGKARVVWQAIDLEEVKHIFQQHNLIVLEIYPTLGKMFREHPSVKKLSKEFEVRTVFISPAADEEIRTVQKSMEFVSPDEAVAAIMLPQLIRRSQQQGKLLTSAELDDLKIRASAAYKEIQMGISYTDFIINHDGEASDHWKLSPPIGDAGKTLIKFVEILST